MIGRYNTIWRRIAAFLVDLVPMSPAVAVGLMYSRYAHGAAVGVWWSVTMLVVGLAYSIYFHGRYGATPGKSIFHCRVVRAGDESKVTYAIAARREIPTMVLGVVGAAETHWASLDRPHIAAVLSGVVACGTGADMITCLLNQKRRALHDFIGSTVVVTEEPIHAPAPTPSAGATSVGRKSR
jgi:uncharacterized RDD family membrane protein YckC